MATANQCEKALKAWIYEVTKQEPRPEPLIDALRNGQLLCHLANALDPTCNLKINQLMTVFHTRENISRFLDWSRAQRVGEQNLFHAEHLLDDNYAEQVFKTLILLYEQFEGGTQLTLDSYNLRDNVTKKNEKSGKKQNQGTPPPTDKVSESGRAHGKADLELGDRLEKDKTADKKPERLTPFMMGKNLIGVKAKQLSMFNKGKGKKNHDQTPKSMSPQSPVSDIISPLEENQSVWLDSPSRISAVDDGIGKSSIQGLSKLASFVKQVSSISSNNDAHELDCRENDQFVMQVDPRPMGPRKFQVNKSGTPVTVSSCKDTVPTRIEHGGDIKSTTACDASPSNYHKAEGGCGARKKFADFLKANPPTDQERKRVYGDSAQLSQASTMEKRLQPILTYEENFMLGRPTQIENPTIKVVRTNKKLMTFLQKQPSKAPVVRGFPVSVPCSVGRGEENRSRMHNFTTVPVKEVSLYPFGRRKAIKRSTGQSNFVRNRQTYRNLLQRPHFDLESKRSQFMIEQLQFKEAKVNDKSTAPSDTNFIVPGMQCYVPDDEHVWLPAQIVRCDEKSGDVEVVVSFEDGIAETRLVDLHNPKIIKAIGGPKATKVESLPLAWTGDTIEGVEDMQSLRFLNEASILYNLKKRFLASLPYTFTNTIVIALNPYKWMDSLYGDEPSKLYMKCHGLKKLQPHVYATSAAAYQHLLQTGSNQSILVSGESGAGKTETTKIIMQHLTSIAGGLDDSTVDKVIRVNPLLESFGNAKTSRNDNSSRFGKFTQLQFDASGILVGAKCEAYLLEKSRVVSLVQGERNYHIFHQLLAGASAEERQQLQLDTNKSFRYLGDSSEQTVIDGFDDAKLFTATCRSLSLIGLNNDQQFTLFKILSGLLHLGEVQFMETDEEGSASQNVEQLCVVSELLGLASTKVEGALCTRSVVARNESVTVSLSVADAEENRDSLAKAIYSKIFDWMVRRINQAIAVDDDVCSGQIGVLDIFGFEEFAHNGFEQFCINYANEKLQQKFTFDVFKTVEEEYTREGLQWDHIEYPDNREIIELIDGKMGILALMNDHLRQPRGSEEALVNKIRASAESQLDSTCIQFPKVNRTQFTINHFAGPVTYETVGFMEKHRDTLQNDLMDLVLTSELDLLTEFFGSSEAPRETKMSKSRKSTSSKKSLGTQFKSSLSQLMDNIKTTNTHYVRCIKPNANKSSTEFDNQMVIEQLRSAGVIEAIRITRSGYPSRLTPHELATKYYIMFPPSMQRRDVFQTCSAFMTAIGRRSPLEYQIGKSLIYFKGGVLEELEAMKSDFYYNEATCIQKVVLGYIQRQRFRRMIEAITALQAWSRMVLERAEYQYARNAVITIQRVWKRYLNKDLIDSEARGHSYDNMQENDFVRMSDGEWVDDEDADDRLTEGSESSFECSEPVASAYKSLKATQPSHTQLPSKQLSYESTKRDSTSYNPSVHRTLNMDEISESAKRILDAVERKENLEPISLQEENTILRWENRNLKYDLEMMREQCKDLQSIIVEINRSRKR
uniref:Myosinlike protein putative n=1 Tax=Albugo laibachii Nc14 TaxID=890382 RepID=F0W4J6_9STRA|nr:myosinlike protein putative [Albugo laibachii Nc14]|eukprot:CCA16029.1 myosinlike protein putative [Albugo laibachii Nc14]